MDKPTRTITKASGATAVKNLKTVASNLESGLAGSSSGAAESTFKSGKHVCFTVHKKGDEPTKETMQAGIEAVYNYLVVLTSRLCIGLEQGKEGRWHGQGYASFVKAKKLSQLRSYAKAIDESLTGDDGSIGVTMHYIRAKGTPAENLAYCTKEGSSLVHGEFPKKHDQGGRTDLNAMVRWVESNAMENNAEWNMLRTHPEVFFKYMGAAKRTLQLARKIARRKIGFQKPNVRLYWGKTELGKSRRAQFEADRLVGPENVYRKEPGKWWPGYDGERCCIIEEFDGSWCSPTTFLMWLDGYAWTAEEKHGSVVPYIKDIWITSNSHIEDWWPEAREKRPSDGKWAAIARRFSEVVKFGEGLHNEPWSPPVDGSDGVSPMDQDQEKGKEAMSED